MALAVLRSHLPLLLMLVACRPVATPPSAADRATRARMEEAARRERQGDHAGAAAVYEQIPSGTGSPREAARGLVRAAQMREDAGDPTRASDTAWRAIDTYPDAVPSRDAVKVLHRVARVEGDAGLRRFRAGLLERRGKLGKTEIGDLLAFTAAEVAAELGERDAARREYQAMASAYTQSGLFDDALVRAAGLAREAGDASGALELLEALVATKRTAYIVGSYDLQHLHEAALEIGRIHLERRDHRAAIRAFERLRDELGENRLRDDAQWHIVQAHEAAGDRPAACKALERLVGQFPGSRWLRRGEAARARERLSC